MFLQYPFHALTQAELVGRHHDTSASGVLWHYRPMALWSSSFHAEVLLPSDVFTFAHGRRQVFLCFRKPGAVWPETSTVEP